MARLTISPTRLLAADLAALRAARKREHPPTPPSDRP